jgi:histidinol dehydrogenase
LAQELDIRATDFAQKFSALLGAKREQAEDVDAAARAIIAAVRERGDAALYDLSERFDHVNLREKGLRVTQAEIDAALTQVPTSTMAALVLACGRIETHHLRQIPTDDLYKDTMGVELGHKWSPVDAAGLYVPGGTASYPSSVLMNAIPAKAAGVPRLVMTVPTPRGELSPLVLAAAHIAGVDEIYRVGGAQAIAALAYGTESIAPVAKIVGPGNAYVTAAKRLVFGTVGIDMIAGPSEVVIVADRETNPVWIAADLLAQAEHDASAQSILITDDRFFAQAVKAEVAAQLARLPRSAIASASWRDYGAIILVESLSQAPALVNRLAPEHLELAIETPDALLGEIRNAGAIFLGRHTPEAMGDYVAGSNHVLPTARSARFFSGLGTLDFMKRSSILKLDPASLEALGPAAIALARAEGLEAHSRSVGVRIGVPPAEESGSKANE